MITLTILLILALLLLIVVAIFGLPLIDVLVAILIIMGIIKLFTRKK